MRKTTLALLVALSACLDPSGPVPNSQLHFLVQAPTAPPLLAPSASFYAKSGTDRLVRLYYQGASPGDTGETFLQFEVRANSLARRPDGTTFQPGDSILITVAVSDPTRFDFGFSPSGLRFNASDPARLHIEYNHSDHDFNRDGKEDSEDIAAENMLSIWRRELPDSLWTRLGSVKNEEADEIEAAILSFTQFAVAW